MFDVPTGRWKICYTYRLPEEKYAIPYSYCTWADDPVIPTYPVHHYFSCCPGEAYPDQLSVSAIVAAHGPCSCFDFTFWPATWDATVGPMGGWKYVETGCAGGTVTLTIWPSACVTGGMTWHLKAVYPGGNKDVFMNVGCGHGFDINMIMNRVDYCPGTTISWFVSWAWAIP